MSIQGSVGPVSRWHALRPLGCSSGFYSTGTYYLCAVHDLGCLCVEDVPVRKPCWFSHSVSVLSRGFSIKEMV